jgi:hypothetical protein
MAKRGQAILVVVQAHSDMGRDRYIGWSAGARRRNIRFLAYNTRYLILPWVRVPHLASHILGKMTSQLPQHWERMYGHSVLFRRNLHRPEPLPRHAEIILGK